MAGSTRVGRGRTAIECPATVDGADPKEEMLQ